MSNSLSSFSWLWGPPNCHNTMDTLLDIPPWVKDALNIKDMTVYINRHDNSEYVIHDTQEEMIAPLGENPWGGMEYDKSVYEMSHGTDYRYDDPLYTEQQQSDTLEDMWEENDTLQQQTFKAPKSRKRKHQTSLFDYTPEAKKMAKIAFVNYFMDNPEQPSVDLLGQVYEILDGFKITQQTLDVVSAVIQCVCAKSLKNTMGGVKRNKRFKSQVQYILSKVQAGS